MRAIEANLSHKIDKKCRRHRRRLAGRASTEKFIMCGQNGMPIGAATTSKRNENNSTGQKHQTCALVIIEIHAGWSIGKLWLGAVRLGVECDAHLLRLIGLRAG